MKRFVILYNTKNEIADIDIKEVYPNMCDVHKPESGLCLVLAENILQALEKYKAMTGNEII